MSLPHHQVAHRVDSGQTVASVGVPRAADDWGYVLTCENLLNLVCFHIKYVNRAFLGPHGEVTALRRNVEATVFREEELTVFHAHNFFASGEVRHFDAVVSADRHDLLAVRCEL